VGSFPPQVVRLVRALHGNFAPSIDTTRSNDGKHIIYCLADHRVNRFSGTTNPDGGGHSLFFRRENQECPPPSQSRALPARRIDALGATPYL
jgi:hypothetical protein